MTPGCSSKYKALIVNSKAECEQDVLRPGRTVVQLWDYTPAARCLLLQSLSNYNWNGINDAIECKSDSIDAIYNDFINIVK